MKPKDSQRDDSHTLFNSEEASSARRFNLLSRFFDLESDNDNFITSTNILQKYLNATLKW